MRDWPDETSGHVAEVDVEVAPATWPPGLRHVLREDLARADAFDEHRAEVADQRRDEILRLQSVGGAHGGRLLPERAEDAADDFRLPIEIDQAFFDQSRQFQITVQLKHLLG